MKRIRQLWFSVAACCALLITAVPVAAQVTETGTIEVGFDILLLG